MGLKIANFRLSPYQMWSVKKHLHTYIDFNVGDTDGSITPGFGTLSAFLEQPVFKSKGEGKVKTLLRSLFGWFYCSGR